MKTSFKYGVSAIALLAAISFAQAQTNERHGGGEHGAAPQGEHGMQGGAAHTEHNGGAIQHQGRSAEENGGQRERGRAANEHEQGGAHNGRIAEERGEGGAKRQGRTAEETHPAQQGHEANHSGEQHGQSAEHNRGAEQGRQVERNRAETQAEREGGRAGEAERSARTERETRGVQGEETRGRETEFGGARGNEAEGRGARDNGRFASISREQRTRIHTILAGDSAIHHYHRADADFPLRVGTRIPGVFEFYDPPARVVQIDPIFEGYKIVVLDDVILVVDPATREIVDVIRT